MKFENLTIFGTVRKNLSKLDFSNRSWKLNTLDKFRIALLILDMGNQVSVFDQSCLISDSEASDLPPLPLTLSSETDF